MNEHKRMSSIARRMARSWTFRLFGIFLWLDLFIAVLAMGGYCYTMEVAALGSFESDIQRGFDADLSGNIKDAVDSARYLFTDPGGTWYQLELGEFLRVLGALMLVLIFIEFIMLLMQRGGGRRSANRLLRPLTQMTRTAEKLTSQHAGEARFENLEHAIENISPTAPNVKLKTGDKELKGLEGAINNLVVRMHESYKEQNRFVSDASHELRTPIAVIQGYSSMLERWGKNDEKILDEGIAAIKSEAEHMNALVEQLLFLARGDSGRTELSIERFNLSQLIHEVYEEYMMIDAAHEYAFNGPGVAMCRADQGLIKQVARVLTDNAIKYTPEGGRITLRVEAGDTPGFQVQDTGIGISAEDMPRIFERFFRSDPSRGRATGGTGLGLSIAKWIVDRHGGYFEVLSRQGIGTRISVFLPQKAEAEDPVHGEKA